MGIIKNIFISPFLLLFSSTQTVFSGFLLVTEARSSCEEDLTSTGDAPADIVLVTASPPTTENPQEDPSTMAGDSSRPGPSAGGGGLGDGGGLAPRPSPAALLAPQQHPGFPPSPALPPHGSEEIFAHPHELRGRGTAEKETLRVRYGTDLNLLYTAAECIAGEFRNSINPDFDQTKWQRKGMQLLYVSVERETTQSQSQGEGEEHQAQGRGRSFECFGRDLDHQSGGIWIDIMSGGIWTQDQVSQ